MNKIAYARNSVNPFCKKKKKLWCSLFFRVISAVERTLRWNSIRCDGWLRVMCGLFAAGGRGHCYARPRCVGEGSLGRGRRKGSSPFTPRRDFAPFETHSAAGGRGHCYARPRCVGEGSLGRGRRKGRSPFTPRRDFVPFETQSAAGGRGHCYARPRCVGKGSLGRGRRKGRRPFTPRRDFVPFETHSVPLFRHLLSTWAYRRRLVRFGQ